MLADFGLLEIGLGFGTSLILTIVGIKLRNRRLALKSLAGVKSELEENRESATTIIKDLAEDIKSDQVGEKRLSRSTTEFSTSAYNNFVDSGHMGILSNELQERLRTHYAEVQVINGELRDRSKRPLGSDDNSDVRPSFDDSGTIFDLLIICSEEHRKEIFEEIDDSPVNHAAKLLRELTDTKLAQESDTAKREDINFDSVHKDVKKDLEGRWLGL